MVYALLWVEHLIVLLLLIALFLACVGRLRRRWLRMLLWAPFLVLLLSFYGLQTVFTAILQLSSGAMGNFWPPQVHWFWQMLLLTVAIFAGALYMSLRGFRRAAPTAPTVAAGWPRGRLAIVLGAAAALHLMTFWNLESALRQQMATARAEASVLALSVAPPRVPDAENAALIYEQASQLVFTIDWSKIARENAEYAGNRDQGWTFNAKDPGLRPFLKAHATAIALLHKAAAKPGCYFEHDYYHPERLGDVSERRIFQNAGMLLVLEARAKAADGNVRGTIEDINTLFAMSRHISAVPVASVGLILSWTLEHDAVEALQHLFLDATVTADDLNALHIADATSYQKLLERDLRMEEAYRLAIFCDYAEPRTGADAGGRIMGPLGPVWRVLLCADTLTGHGRASGQLRQIAAQPYYKTRDQWDSLPDLAATAPADFLTRIFLPSLARFAELAAKYDAFRDLVRLGVAAERYRLNYRKFPAHLDDLAPDFIPVVPVDPFDGKPMRMKRTRRGLVFYSIGPDMVDNGGVQFNGAKQTGDITFEVPGRMP